MISKLTIKNVALIENAEVEFGSGLNVLSGETGSGKSVILDSVNFVLGAKADKTMIRYGENECFVKAEFIVSENNPALSALEDLDIEKDENIIITRKYNMDGKGSIKINGNTVTAAMLKKVTSSLVDVHGQSEHFYLLSESNQLKVLDSLAGEKLIRLKESLSSGVAQYKAINKQMSVFSGDVGERAKRIDILKFQIDEIETAAVKEDEEEQLKEKRDKINNAEKIANSVKEAVSYLSSDGAGLDDINEARRSIQSISRYSEEYASLAERLENLAAEADDIAQTLAEAEEGLFFDENEAEAVENRLDTIRLLKKKYGADVKSIEKFLENAKNEYDLLVNCDEEYEKLDKKRGILLKNNYDLCRKMTVLRQKTASEFAQRVIAELKSLNIPNAKFEVQFSDYDESSSAKASENGLDGICFMFSANAGEPLKPLGKIISGGEMSRFMLSIKTQLSGLNGISTYIFDEIDAGISGKTAKVVAEKIAKVAKNTQVIAVSHLAQIAAMSDEQMLIEKHDENGKTYTGVHALDKKGRIEELVRLLGGESDSEYAVKHAEELLNNSIQYKNSL